MKERWRYIADDGVSASFGLAADEFLMGSYGGVASWPATLRLYTYRSHCALVGRFQNVEAEVRVEECRRLAVPINRRPTGGGAIVMGGGQLGLSLVTSAVGGAAARPPSELFQRYAGGILAGLRRLGVQASFRPKNDVEVAGRKIAGLGICIDEGGGLLFHASILADLDVAFMLRVLNIPLEKISDKEIAAFADRLTTISREAGRPVTAQEAREAVAQGFEEAFNVELVPEPLTPLEIAAVQRLEQDKYLSDAWVYEVSPTADMVGQSIIKTPDGLLHVYVARTGQVIKSVLITGDFFSSPKAVASLEAALKWERAERTAIQRAVREIAAQQGDGAFGVTPEHVVDAVCEAVQHAKPEEVRG